MRRYTLLTAVIDFLFRYSGRLEVRWATNSSVAGYVANNPIGGSYVL